MTDAPPKTGRPIPGWLKTALELGPVLLFFVAYLRLKDRTFVISGTEYESFIIVTVAFIPLFLVCTGLLWALTGRLSRMQVLTTVLIVLFGGMAFLFNDERWAKMDTSVIYAIFAAILGFGLWRGKSYLSMVMSEALPLTERGWMILTKRMAWLFAGLAVANEVAWRTLETETWVWLKTFGLPGAMFAFFIFQAGLIKRETPPDSDAGSAAE
ncbi:septation protein IspZ [Jannaschia sp. Os4]|uniref:inner membrane-spanning protein YciB n=1 Tax=Jannaschia sp. Os4 TaxID=2807617 RepID=UPI00193A1763|nr:inner membrane-spanning protein YciB [Jannaschia sp. Os4]MBM2574807.1 septation protein IspZ [Jannaschia sp. Os4]